VTVIAANVALPRAPGITYVDVETAAQLHAAALDAFDACDVLLMAAAVADYRPAEVFTGKVKKDQQGESLALQLERTEDVLTALAARRRSGQVLVGFAAESGEGAVAYGRGKLERKGLDAVVVNDIAQPGIGFDTADNEVTIVTAGGEQAVPRAAKADVARAILDMILSQRSSDVVRVR
jgi:phosphopantothenoylcysteine decarboxylase/phosphopantothenate--cysteine ligase